MVITRAGLGPAASLVALLASALVGCTLGPDYHRPELQLPQTFRSADTTTNAPDVPNAGNAANANNAAGAADLAEVVNTAWWQAFGDADLDALIMEAIEANQDLQLAALRVEQFDARLQMSRGARYPYVGYGTTTNRQRYSEERPVLLPPQADPYQNAFVVNSNFGWELDLWGRVRRVNEAALADLLATEEARRGVMLTVVTDVATSYVQLVALDHQLALARRTLRNRQDAADLLQTKQEGGSATRLAVAEARAAVAEVAATIPSLEREIATLENGISALVGRNTRPVARNPMEVLALPPVPQGVPSDVLTRRPDVLAAEQNLVSANALIGAAKAQYFPTISLTGALGLGSNDLSRLLLHSATTGAIGVDVLGTIFSGGRIEGDVRQTEAVQKQMIVKYQQAVLTALREVEDALVFRAKAGEQLDAVGRQVDALQDLVGLWKTRYDGGQSTYLDVLDAERQLYAAQDQQAQRRRDTYVALISVYKAMGGGWMIEQERLRLPKEPEPVVAAHAHNAAAHVP